MRVLLIVLTMSIIPQAAWCALASTGEMFGEVAGDQYGSAVCMVDFNADGEQDLVVSAPAADDAGISSGKVYIYFGGSAADAEPDLILAGAAGSFFGQTLSSAGDFNNDTYEDLLVGAPFYDLPDNNAGAVGLYYGGPSPDTIVDHIFVGSEADDNFGMGVTPIGDFNNDTYDDIAIGAYHADWGSFENSGKVYIYYGGPGPDFAVDKVLVGLADGERFGRSLAGGDFSGDGIDDLAVGAYSYDGSLVNQGRVYWFYGGTGPDSLIDLHVNGQNAGDYAGWSLASGLINDDGYQDLAVGAYGYAVDDSSAGRMDVFFGGPDLDNSPDYSHAGSRAAGDQIGFAVTTGVDLNADGSHETVVGMPGGSDLAEEGGGILVINGGAVPDFADQYVGQNDNEMLGGAVGFWPDYGTSGVVVAGAAAYNNYQGRVVLLLPSEGCCVLRGDIDHSGGGPDIADLVYLVTYMFQGGPEPPCMEEANIDGSGTPVPDIADLVDLVNYMFQDGPDPVDCPA